MQYLNTELYSRQMYHCTVDSILEYERESWYQYDTLYASVFIVSQRIENGEVPQFRRLLFSPASQPVSGYLLDTLYALYAFVADKNDDLWILRFRLSHKKRSH
jgi:hypothetical protein